MLGPGGRHLVSAQALVVAVAVLQQQGPPLLVSLEKDFVLVPNGLKANTG